MRRAGRRRSPAASRCCTARSTRSSTASSRARSSSISAPTRCCSKRRSTSSSRNPYFAWTVHLDGDREMHDQLGVPGRRLRPRGRGDPAREDSAASASTSTAPCSTTPSPNAWRGSSTRSRRSGVDGITVSPGYAYERAPDQAHFLNRRTHQGAVPRHLPPRPQPTGRSTSRACSSISSPATRTITARPWGNPTRNYFGWQRPCYLLGEGYRQELQGADGRRPTGTPTAPAITRNAPTAWCIAATRRPRSSMR